MYDLVESCFRPIVGLPCWNVDRWHGSLLDMHFGDPSLVIREPTERLKNRNVTVQGQWRLWIYICGWRIYNGKNELAHCESSVDVIDKAAHFLDGQRLLSSPSWNENHKMWLFRFDLGGSIITQGRDDYEDLTTDQWTLYEPDGYTLCSDQLGRLSRTRAAAK